MFGADPNPHVYGLMPSCADHIHWAGGHWTDSRGAVGEHSDAGGGHAHSGCSVYLGDNFPDEYRNNVFMCNIHGNRLNRDRLERHGSGYVAKHEKDFLFANDPWHRGLVVKYGPDGGLYVADWCDTGECHNYEVADVTNGRIVKVTYERGTGSAERGAASAEREAPELRRAGSVSDRRKPFDLQKLTDAELVEMQRHKNDWWVRHARRVLQERAAAKTLKPDTADNLRKQFAASTTTQARLRALWALHCLGDATEADLLAALGDADEHVRAWGVTLAVEATNISSTRQSQLTKMATDETSARVRVRLASAVQRLPLASAYGMLSGLLLNEQAADDEFLAPMIWYATESMARATVLLDGPAPQFTAAVNSKIPAVRRFAARYIVLTANDHADAQADRTQRDRQTADVVETLLRHGASEGAAVLADVCTGIVTALRGTRSLPKPATWNDTYARVVATSSDSVRNDALKLAVLFGDDEVMGKLHSTLSDTSVTLAARRHALDLLIGKRSPELGQTLVALVDDDALRSDALRALAAFDDATAAEAIITRFAKFTDAEKADALQTLASRPSYALALLEAVEMGRIDRADVPTGVAGQLAGLKNKTVDERLAAVWGSVRPTSEVRKQQAERLKQVLTSAAMAKADPARGRALFAKSCAACHKLFDEGGKIGPELTGSQRANVDYILENVLDPSAKVGRLYQVTVLELVDGRVVQGVVTDENDLSLSIQTINEQLTIAKSDIDGRRQTNLSLMPEGLFDKLGDAELRDLMAYLATGTR